ncbi:sugar porter family MFS transporter [Roseibacillus ishigakijimensis]|uniref:Sugar porter family MFS transporter n=1 Tax=Roseibacillus ishigakijimensis TaxID=454146 RepID=A0A934VLM0_9BACT|nr:sugar porter family MFS transporter [Roseibacillus ishigakijimensis]MBK1833030.1 sugar porter family MFS transporter [Roseibacillus ishigakijimensis]
MNKNRLFLWALTSALAGFLFGFDTVVISGAEKKIQSLWGLDSWTHGFATSAALWGTVLGAILGAWPSDRFGRQKTLLWIGIFYLLSALGSAFAPEVNSFIIARFLGGVGVGVSTVAGPMYISEIAPPDKRGRLTGLFQFNIVFGILVAYLSNWLIGESMGANAWRWMLGVEAIPALIYTGMCLRIPESPRWLITRKGERSAAKATLAQVNPEADDATIEALVTEIEQSAGKDTAAKGLPFARLKLPILLAFLVAFFNQLSGINAILYFAPRIFELTGMGDQVALLQSIGIGITNLVFTFLGLYLIDRLGRKTLLLIGSVGYIVSLGLCSWAFHSETFGIVPVCIFGFIAAHAVGQGAVIWVLISEIFPNKFRAAGQSLGSATHWVFAAALTLVFPYVVASIPPATIFGFFAFMMALQLVWVLTMVPETKGVPLEEIEKKLGVS